MRLRRWKGCLWRDLDERIAELQRTREELQTVTAGGSRTIPEVQNFAKMRLRRTASDHSQPFLGIKWVIIPKDSSDLWHFIFTSRAKKVINFSVYTVTWGP